MADLRHMRTVTGAALWALGLILSAPPPLHAQQAPADRELAQARENAKWEQASAGRRLEVLLKDEPKPHPCQIFVEWSPRLYTIAAGTNFSRTACAAATVSRASTPRPSPRSTTSPAS